jgi:hypothetical protein
MGGVELRGGFIRTIPVQYRMPLGADHVGQGAAEAAAADDAYRFHGLHDFGLQPFFSGSPRP